MLFYYINEPKSEMPGPKSKIRILSEYPTIIVEGKADFVATFMVNNAPIYRAWCSFWVLCVPLDTEFRPFVVDDLFWFLSLCRF